MDFENMFLYVYDKLKENDGISSHKEDQTFRNRYNHTKRVYKWCLAIKDDFPNVNLDAVLTAAIFHDCGRGTKNEDHAKRGAIIFIEYAKKNYFDYEFTMLVSDVIARHSDKSALNDSAAPDELKMLLEADLLDEEGALGIVWDLLSEGHKNPLDYNCALNAIEKHSVHILNQNYMVTPIAKMYWERKKKIVKTFKDEIEQDLFIE